MYRSSFTTSNLVYRRIECYLPNPSKLSGLCGFTEVSPIIITVVDAPMGMSDSPMLKNIMEQLMAENKKRGQIPWEMLAEVWSSFEAYNKKQTGFINYKSHPTYLTGLRVIKVK